MDHDSEKSKVIIIAGMHRSGTSLTAGLLQTAGLNIGERLMPAASDNKRGFFEDLDFEEFQDEVLRKRGLTYLVDIPDPIILDTEEMKKARKLIDARMGLPLWGWKDPRTALFLDFWSNELPDANFVFVYRHPVEVVFSLLRRGGPKVIKDPARMFRVWEVFNNKVLEFMKKHPEKSTLCHIHGMLQDKEKFSALLTSRVGLPGSPAFDKLYESGLLHHMYIPDWLDLYLKKEYPGMVKTYEELQSLADMPYHESFHSCEKDAQFLAEAMGELMVVHDKLTNLSKLELESICQGDLMMFELENMDKQQLIQEYRLIRSEYNKLLYSKAQRLDRRLKRYPTLNKLAKATYESLVNTRNLLTGQSSMVPEERVGAAGIEYDAPYDTRWAHEDTRFDRVLHICFKETGGPRAAAGYLPGHKLCVPMNRILERQDYDAILKRCSEDRINTIVLHTIWNGTRELLNVLRKEIAPIRTCFIWYGNTAQFVDRMVRLTFVEVLRLKHDGLLDGVASVKSGLEVVSDAISGKPMYSLPPSIGSHAAVHNKVHKAVMIPLRDIWRKNFYTNLYSAGSLDGLETIFTNVLFTNYNEIKLKPKVKYIGDDGMASRDEVFSKLRMVDSVMNVTLSECQPLVFLEALAFSVPCLTGPIQLGCLDEHPYRKLTEVSRADSLTDVVAALKNVLNFRRERGDELSDMMKDYETRLHKAAIDNYIDFLKL